jgi:3-oxoadipate enol-lactonase
MPLIQTNGLQMHVETFGEQGDPILMIHGALSDLMQNWRMILKPLSERFRLIGVDLRGHGQTNNPTGSFTLQDLRDDVLGVLDALEIPKVHLLGCSLGGYVSMALRAQHPERVGSLALAGVKVGWTPADAADRAAFFVPEVIAQTYPLWIPHMARAHATHYGMEHWRTLVSQVSALLQTLPDEPTASLETLEAEAGQRALFYCLGDRDEMVPLEEVMTIKRARPDADILVVPHSGHLFREYNPFVFSHAYTDFLRKNRLNAERA